ncbi:HEAT repeat domain-containing protein [Streptomyces sp. NPDC048606]|uniref:HEAT repeat domain-containing protein n=1 Tax=Streptomyces sp. NPDC048606 TaxID=3154726 RepID=UPI00343882A2
MEFARMLDNHPWGAFSHAYGTAEDLPALLHALTGDDEEEAREALTELYGCVLHQGTVYPATAEVAPFLADIAAAGHRTADVVELLGGMAESEDEHGVAPGAVRAAVTRQLPLLLPLLTAPEPEVREAAAWAVSQTRAADTALPALLARWTEESDPRVRAEVLAAISRLDRDAAADAAAGVPHPSAPARLRMAALFARLDADRPWTGTDHAVMLSLLPADPLGLGRFDHARGEPLAAVTDTLLRRDDATHREAAFTLIDAALRDDRPEVRGEAIWAAERACAHSRAAPAHLLPALRAAAVDQDAVLSVAAVLRGLGTLAAPAADVLAPLAGRDPDRDDDLADRALAALVRVAPAEAAPLLARALGRRPRALAATGEFPGPDGAPFPYDAELLDAVRRVLAHPRNLTGNETARLTGLLAGWGARAAAALPELYAALPHAPEAAARAVAAVAAHCPPDERERAAARLRTEAEAGGIAAARASYALTGEHGPLVRLLDRDLAAGGGALRGSVDALAALGPRAAALAPALRSALHGALDGPDLPSGPALDTVTVLAEALWHVTGDAAPVVAALGAVLDGAAASPWSHRSAARAARTAALLGPRARPLAARLEVLVGEPVTAPAAVLALTSLGHRASPGPPARMAAVLDSAEREADPTGALDALELLATGGDGAPTADDLRRLARLADGDARTVRSGVEGRIVPRDEAFRDRARNLLTVFTAAGRGTGTAHDGRP